MNEVDGVGAGAERGYSLSALAHAMAAPMPAAPAPATAGSPVPGSPYATYAGSNATTIPDGEAEVVDDDFVIAREPNVVQRLITMIKSSPRNLAIAAGAVGFTVLVSALAFCGGGASSKDKQVAAAKSSDTNSSATTKTAVATAEPTPEPGETTAEPTTAVVRAPTEPAEASGPTPEELAAATAPEPATTEPPVTPPKTGKPAKRASTGGTKGEKKLGGKQVILEDDAQARAAKPVPTAPKADQAAIQKARTAYAAGNKRFFAGDLNGAIKFYRQSLGFYPGYVAGYRGLGLAYTQQGDKPKALQALKTYVSSVPGAKDAALIRKRISSLEGK